MHTVWLIASLQTYHFVSTFRAFINQSRIYSIRWWRGNWATTVTKHSIIISVCNCDDGGEDTVWVGKVSWFTEEDTTHLVLRWTPEELVLGGVMATVAKSTITTRVPWVALVYAFVGICREGEFIRKCIYVRCLNVQLRRKEEFYRNKCYTWFTCTYTSTYN